MGVCGLQTAPAEQYTAVLTSLRGAGLLLAASPDHPK